MMHRPIVGQSLTVVITTLSNTYVLFYSQIAIYFFLGACPSELEFKTVIPGELEFTTSQGTSN